MSTSSLRNDCISSLNSPLVEITLMTSQQSSQFHYNELINDDDLPLQKDNLLSSRAESSSDSLSVRYLQTVDPRFLSLSSSRSSTPSSTDATPSPTLTPTDISEPRNRPTKSSNSLASAIITTSLRSARPGHNVQANQPNSYTASPGTTSEVGHATTSDQFSYQTSSRRAASDPQDRTQPAITELHYPAADAPFYPRALPDGLIQSLDACIRQDRGAQCMACGLMKTKRNMNNAKFPKRHVFEVHTNPLSVLYAQGILSSDSQKDGLYVAIAVLRMKSARAKPRTPPEVLVEANMVIQELQRGVTERSEVMMIPSIRAWIRHFTEASMGWSCNRCGQRYTRKTSYDRHNCAADGLRERDAQEDMDHCNSARTDRLQASLVGSFGPSFHSK